MVDERDRDTRIIVAEGYEQDLPQIRETLETIFKKEISDMKLELLI